MNQASDMLLIQSLAFFGTKWLFLEKNFKNDNFLNGIKTKQDNIKNSNIVEKIQFGKYLLWEKTSFFRASANT